MGRFLLNEMERGIMNMRYHDRGDWLIQAADIFAAPFSLA